MTLDHVSVRLKACKPMTNWKTFRKNTAFQSTVEYYFGRTQRMTITKQEPRGTSKLMLEFHHPAYHCLDEGSVLAVTWLVNIQLESICLGKAPRNLPGKNITKFNSKQNPQLLWLVMEVDFISSENSPSPGSVCALHTSRYSIWL